MIYPFIATVTDAIDVIITKKVFTTFKQLTPRTLAWWIFVWITILGLLLSPWLVHIQPAALSWQYLGLVLLMAILAANYNFLYYYGLRYEHISEIEPFFLFNPLIAILIAGIFYPSERFWQIYLAIMIASIFLFWSHLKKRHVVLGKPLLAVLGFSLLFGLEAVIIKQLLIVYSPVALYLIRVITTALFIWVLEKGKIPLLTLRQIPYFVLLAAGALVTNSLIYLSYGLQGISSTIFILILSPVLVYALAVLFLKEKLIWKNLVTSLVIILLIIWVNLST